MIFFFQFQFEDLFSNTPPAKSQNFFIMSHPSTSKGKKSGKNENDMVRFSNDQKITLLEFCKNNYDDMYGNKLPGSQQMKKDQKWLEFVKMINEE